MIRVFNLSANLTVLKNGAVHTSTQSLNPNTPITVVGKRILYYDLAQG